MSLSRVTQGPRFLAWNKRLVSADGEELSVSDPLGPPASTATAR